MSALSRVNGKGMGATLLQATPVARPWGRRSLPPGFERFDGDEPIGEIHHAPAEGAAAPLLIKHLFSAERLSIQVHPDDAAAAALGLPRGKDEAWAILAAEPGATLGLGLRLQASREEVHAAALSGGIEQLVDWHPVTAGDFFFSPGGTIHAIGGGLSLIEIQQNSDVTYRLYDYGRPRELHIERALSVADFHPWRANREAKQLSGNRRVLLSGATFVVEEWNLTGRFNLTPAAALLAIPRAGVGRVENAAMRVGQVWSIEDEAELHSEDGITLLVAYPGSEVITGLEI